MMYRSNFDLNIGRAVRLTTRVIRVRCTHRIGNLYHGNIKSNSKIASYSLNSINSIKYFIFI